MTWSLAGGADQNLFTIDPTTGRLEFINAPDLDSHADLSSSGNHSYAVVVRLKMRHQIYQTFSCS